MCRRLAVVVLAGAACRAGAAAPIDSTDAGSEGATVTVADTTSAALDAEATNATASDPSAPGDTTAEGEGEGATSATAGDGAAGDRGTEAGSDGGTPGCARAPVVGATTETIDVDGVERTYLVVVPASLDGSIPAPVLLGFHGGNGTSEYAAEAYGLTGAEPMLYVYPQAPYWKEAGGVGWNVDPAGVDFPYFDAMLVDLAEKYCVDLDRVFAAGQSNGAFFVHALGCYRPEALRGIAAVAGGGPPGACTPSTLATMMVHGTADTTVPIESGAFARDYWRAANGCGDATSPIDPAPCIAYEGCAEPVVWCEHPGGHPWPDFAGEAIRAFFLGL